MNSGRRIMQEEGMPERIPRRGRPRVRRRMELEGPLRCYAPQCNIEKGVETVTLLPEELELLKLVDLNGLGQEEASAVMGVSRRTVWKDLHEARRKVADALIHGKRIEIAGCELRTTGSCPKEAESWSAAGDLHCWRRHRHGGGNME
jgi:predicted DNA-binding protein (UPF0251 family)